MPALVCSARYCIYNDDEYCSKGDIKVGGEAANEVQETYCESFIEKRENSISNAARHTQEHIQVACEACNCIYNDDYVCEADHIDISGVSASDSEETVCGTFRCE